MVKPLLADGLETVQPPAMIRVITSLVSGLILLVIILGVVIAVQPDSFRIERSIVIDAEPANVFPHANSLKLYSKWSPWADIDPDSQFSFDGAETGEGAIFRWSGNDEVGEGSMTIIKSKEPDLVRIQLDFVRPMEDTAFVDFTFKPSGENQTKMSWIMTGTNNFVEKAFFLFMSLDSMVGPMFEEGLTNLKGIVEKG